MHLIKKDQIYKATANRTKKKKNPDKTPINIEDLNTTLTIMNKSSKQKINKGYQPQTKHQTIWT